MTGIQPRPAPLYSTSTQSAGLIFLKTQTKKEEKEREKKQTNLKIKIVNPLPVGGDITTCQRNVYLPVHRLASFHFIAVVLFRTLIE